MFKVNKTSIAKIFLASVIAMIGSLVPSFAVHAETTPDQGECKILSIGFNNGGYYGLSVANGVPETIDMSASNFQATGLAADPNNLLLDTGSNVSARMPSTLNVTTENCKNKKLTLKISGTNGYLNANKFNCCKEEFAPTADTFSFTYNVGEDNCIAYGQDVQNFLTSGAGPYALIALPALLPYVVYAAVGTYGAQQLLNAHYDCKHAAVITDTATGTAIPVESSTKNLLYFQCIDNRANVSVATRCNEGNVFTNGDDGWRRTGFTNVNFYNVAGEQITGTETDYNTDSPCYDATLNGGTGGYTPGCNALLAPLPGLTHVTADIGIGQYINIIIRVAIGLLTAIAVIMLIVEGLRYMTIGSINGKYDARKRIVQILLGLLVALGMFVILSTINPNLLNLEPNIDDVSIQAKEYLSVDDQGTKPTDSSWVCPQASIVLPAGSSQYGNKLLRPINRPINSECKWRDGAPHPGIDISTVVGTDVMAAAGGTVAQITTGCVVGNKGCGNGYGNNVRINHGNVQTIYAHLSSITPGVSRGATVTQGQVIGKSGNTGYSEGPHLHFEVKVGGKKIDPQPHLAN